MVPPARCRTPTNLGRTRSPGRPPAGRSSRPVCCDLGMRGPPFGGGVGGSPGRSLDDQVGRGGLHGNGAGKTTLVREVAGLVKPDAGTARIDAAAHPDRACHLVSIQAQANVPISGLTPRPAVELVGPIRGSSGADARHRAKPPLAALDIGHWADTPAQQLSRGVARLTAFAMTAAAPGRLVVPDEPTNDVDPVRRRLLRGQIRELASGGAAVLLVTHKVLEVGRVVNRLAILDHGRVIACDTPAALATSAGDAPAGAGGSRARRALLAVPDGGRPPQRPGPDGLNVEVRPDPLDLRYDAPRGGSGVVGQAVAVFDATRSGNCRRDRRPARRPRPLGSPSATTSPRVC